MGIRIVRFWLVPPNLLVTKDKTPLFLWILVYLKWRNVRLDHCPSDCG